jgi:hypothetical protein
MNNSELERLLKEARVPARPLEYWEKFPSRVMARLHWLQQRTSTRANQFNPVGRWSLASMVLGTAAVCLIVALGLGIWSGRRNQSRKSLAQVRKYYSEIEPLFPNQLKAIVFDSQGPHLLLAEGPDLPKSAALYVKICLKGDCRSFVTFSGQRIRFGSDTFDVLVDRRGDVLLAGEKMVWSADSSAGQTDYRIEARPLGGAS